MEQLSKSEKQIMDTFWNSPQPLPASDLLSACVGRTWKARSVFPLVKKLIEKGALAEVGCVRRGKTYARTFQPTFSRVEYWAEIIKQEDMITDFMITDMLPILILFAGFNVLDVIAHVIRGKLNDAPTSIPLRSTHLCILMFMIVDAAVILILMCRNIVNVAIQIAQLL